MKFREAVQSEGELLTSISFQSKRYWKYPEQYYEIWRDELTISEQYLKEKIVYVVEIDSRVVGYISFVELTENAKYQRIEIPIGYLIEHMFLLPEFICQGIGSTLLKYSINELEIKDKHLSVFADPYAVDFYIKKGFDEVGFIDSNIPNRTVPFLVMRPK